MSIRPLGVGEILDGAFTLYRRNFARFFLAALLPLVPLIAVWALAPVLLGPGAASGTAGYDAFVLLGSGYQGFASLLSWGAIVALCAGLYANEGPTELGPALGLAARRFPILLLSTILAGVLVFAGLLLLVVPGILLMIGFFAIAQAVVVEGSGPAAALGRSRKLAKGGYRRIAGVWFLAAMIVWLPLVALGAATGVGLAIFSPEALAGSMAFDALVNVASLLLGALTTPFMVAAMVLLYYDRRIRVEGFDLERAVQGLEGGQVAEPSPAV